MTAIYALFYQPHRERPKEAQPYTTKKKKGTKGKNNRQIEQLKKTDPNPKKVKYVINVSTEISPVQYIDPICLVHISSNSFLNSSTQQIENTRQLFTEMPRYSI